MDVDWREQHKFLKCESCIQAIYLTSVALPTSVRSPNATYGTQFGTVPRPTHRNTLQDQAKFEACAHGYVDLSEANYGVALVARDKYGYAVESNVIRLSLVRAPTSPDPKTDQGSHEISFGIYVHTTGFGASGVDQAALAYNHRPYGEHVNSYCGWMTESSSLAWCKRPAILQVGHRTTSWCRTGDDQAGRGGR